LGLNNDLRAQINDEYRLRRASMQAQAQMGTVLKCMS